MTKRNTLLRPAPLGLAVGLALVAGSDLASAQQSGQTGAEQVLEEMVVTARRREEAAQSTPIAITAFSGESLEYRGVTRLDEVVRLVPSMTLENNPSFGGASNSAAIYLQEGAVHPISHER